MLRRSAPETPRIFAKSPPSALWCDGRIVGGWRQRATGEVEVQCLEDVGRQATRAIEAEAARLAGWLDGVRLQPRFPSPLCRA